MIIDIKKTSIQQYLQQTELEDIDKTILLHLLAKKSLLRDGMTLYSPEPNDIYWSIGGFSGNVVEADMPDPFVAELKTASSLNNDWVLKELTNKWSRKMIDREIEKLN